MLLWALALPFAPAATLLDLPNLDALRDYRPKIPLRVYTSDNVLIGEFGQERRDFVAMTELAELMRTAHQDKPALEMMRRALDLDPANAALRDATERLGREVEGRDI